MGTPLGPKYIPYTHMDPLGEGNCRSIRQGMNKISSVASTLARTLQEPYEP